MKRLLFCAAVLVAAIVIVAGYTTISSADGPAQSIETFDVPTATLTYPTDINSAGQVTGYYTDSNGLQHGFLRDRDGAITTFDLPASTGTYPTALNTAGDVTGMYWDASGTPHAFVRRR